MPRDSLMDTGGGEHACSFRFPSPFRHSPTAATVDTAAACAKCATTSGAGGGSAWAGGPSAPSRPHVVETLGPESGTPVLDGSSGSAGGRASPEGMHHGCPAECSASGQGVEPFGCPGCCESDASPGEALPGSGTRTGATDDATLLDGGGGSDGLTDSCRSDTHIHDRWTDGTTPGESASPPPAGPAPSASRGAPSPHECDGFPESGHGSKATDGGIANGQGSKKQKRRAERSEGPGERQRERCGSTASARQGHGRAGKKGQQHKGGRPRTLEAFLQLCRQHVWTGGSTLVNTIILLAAVVGEVIETAAFSLLAEGAALKHRFPRYCALARAAAGAAWRSAVAWSSRARSSVVALGCFACAAGLMGLLLVLRVLRKVLLGFVLPALERLPGYAALRGWLLRVEPWRAVGVAWEAAGTALRRVSAVCRIREAWMFCRQRFGGRAGAHRQEQQGSAGAERAQATGGSREQAGEVVERLLALAGATEEEMDPYAVLGLNADVSESELRRAYRRLAVLVHPDKCQHPRAEEAFKVLRAAWDILSDPVRKQQHDMKRAEQSEMSRAMDEFLVRLHEDLKEAMNTMSCTHCNGKHRRYEVERSPWEARYCARCNARHPASEGDFWAESRMLGFKVTFFAFVDGCIYDVTEWAACQQIPIPADAHSVAYHMSLGQNGRARRPARPPSPGHNEESRREFQDFINRLFKDTQDRRRGPGAAGGPAGNPPPTRGPTPRPPRSSADPAGPGGPSSGPRPGPTAPGAGASASSSSASAQQEPDAQKRRRKVYKKMPKRTGL